MQKSKLNPSSLFWLSGIRDSPQSDVRLAQHPGDMRLDISTPPFMLGLHTQVAAYHA